MSASPAGQDRLWALGEMPSAYSLPADAEADAVHTECRTPGSPDRGQVRADEMHEDNNTASANILVQ